MGKNRDRQESDQGFLNHELESLYHKIADEKLTDTAEGDLPRDEIRIAPGRPERKGQTEDPEADRESGMLGGNRVARLFLFTVPVLVIAAFVLFIWPTPYEYSTLKTSDRTYLVKTNRLTHTKVFFSKRKVADKTPAGNAGPAPPGSIGHQIARGQAAESE